MKHFPEEILFELDLEGGLGIRKRECINRKQYVHNIIRISSLK